MNDYYRAQDLLDKAIRNATDGGPFDHLPTDLQFKAAEIAALLSISQELSQIHHNGINPEFQPATD